MPTSNPTAQGVDTVIPGAAVGSQADFATVLQRSVGRLATWITVGKNEAAWKKSAEKGIQKEKGGI